MVMVQVNTVEALLRVNRAALLAFDHHCLSIHDHRFNLPDAAHLHTRERRCMLAVQS